jgi:hypothetical protein
LGSHGWVIAVTDFLLITCHDDKVGDHSP